MQSGVNKVVLAYSGGLDTSVILRWLQDYYRCEVITFTADLGQGEELEPARAKAELMGVKQIFIEDLQEEFVRDFVFPMFRANAVYEGCYLLGTSIARPLIAKRLIEIAAADRGGRRGARRHRQGQRPGPLRAVLLRAQPAHQGHRTLARVGPGQPREADRVRRGPADPDPARQARRAALLDRRQPSAHLLRGQGARGPVGRARRGDVHAHRLARGGARQADLCRDRLRARRPGERSTASACRRRACCGGSTIWPAPTASAGWTWSRTASSA